MTLLPKPPPAPGPAVAGIDVGAPRKGYHAVILRGTDVVATFHSREPTVIAQWCAEQGATVVAVDAPCRWRVPGSPARAAERELAADRIACFSTPTEANARGHAFYTWMLAGEELYNALAPRYPLYAGDERRSGVSMETFPQAVACALAGETVSAKNKLAVRTQLLVRAGLKVSAFKHIDDIDAALCALAAQYFVRNHYKAYGNADSGYIIVPSPARK
jgi:predicted nuclease with RNAse H fold